MKKIALVSTNQHENFYSFYTGLTDTSYLATKHKKRHIISET